MKIITDIFPAKTVVLPAEHGLTEEQYQALTILTARNASPHARRVDAVRIVVSDDLVMVAADSHGGPMLIFREKYIPERSTILKRNQTSRITTVSGKILIFTKDDDCGCGSKLRAWNPYRTVDSSKDPV